MIEWMRKGFMLAMCAAFAVIGFTTALSLLQVLLGVAGALLGSTGGCLVLAFILYKVYKHYTKER